MKTTSVISLLMAVSNFVFPGCEFLLPCNHTEADPPRQANTSNALQLNGYYFYERWDEDQDTSRTGLWLFFANGVFRAHASTSIEEAQAGQVDLQSFPTNCEYKADWGVYRLLGDSLIIQTWFEKSGRCEGLGIRAGHVLNDTTFVITEGRRSIGSRPDRLNVVFHFRPKSAKPDSICSFLE